MRRTARLNGGNRSIGPGGVPLCRRSSSAGGISAAATTLWRSTGRGRSIPCCVPTEQHCCHALWHSLAPSARILHVGRAMIHYDLRCSQDHAFDGWFKDSAAFERLAKRGLLECPNCGDTKV